MEGRASTFKKVLADFEQRLQGAEFVAIDTELTGAELEGEPDTFEESAQMRLEKNCRIAERYQLIQVGLTIVGKGSCEGRLSFASYNLFAFPYVGPEFLGHEPGFFCQASALQFNAQHRVDFNKWINEGIPYMSREEEKRLIKYHAPLYTGSIEEKTGLLRLWKSLCAARVPFVVHCPLDLFFLLAAFERRPLPKEDPRALALMIRQCAPKVYDTAHLHGVLGRFKRLGLMKYCEDAKARYEELANSSGGAPPLEFELAGDTRARYRNADSNLAHEAGFDSLITAKLFAYLRAISPTRVKEAANRLFLYRSVEYLDLDRAAVEGEVGTNMFDLSRVTLLVAALNPLDVNEATRWISVAGSTYKWIDSTHILVVLRASGGAAVRKAGELAKKVRGVTSWMPFDEWRMAQVASPNKDARPLPGVDCDSGSTEEPEDCSGDAPDTNSATSAAVAIEKGFCLSKRPLLFGMLAVGTGAGAVLLVFWLRGQQHRFAAGQRHLFAAGYRFYIAFSRTVLSGDWLRQSTAEGEGQMRA